MTAHEDNRKIRLEELRFTKKQQWSVATATLTLLGAIFGVVHTLGALGWYEKAFGAISALLVAGFGILHLWSMQNHLAETRRELDANDEGAWWRGGTILGSLIGAIIISAIVVVYYVIWRAATTAT